MQPIQCSLAASGTPWALSLLPSRPTTALGYRGILRQEPWDSDLPTIDTAISHPREQPYLPVGRNQLQDPQSLAVRDARTQQHPSVTEHGHKDNLSLGPTQKPANISSKTSWTTQSFTLRSRLHSPRVRKSFIINQTQQ